MGVEDEPGVQRPSAASAGYTLDGDAPAWSTTPAGYPSGPFHAPPPLPPPPPPGPPPQDGVSIAALVTGLLGMVLVSVVLSIVGLNRTAGGRRRGRGLAVAGLVLSVAWAGVLAVLLPGWISRATAPTSSARPVVATAPASPSSTAPAPTSSASTRPAPKPTPTTPTTPTTKPKVVPARKLYVDQLRTGNCLVISKLGKSVLKVPVVPCRQGHDAEVIGVTQLSGTWHGEAALNRLSDQSCSRIFRRYVGVDIDSSDYGMGWFSPTKESWRDGDRLLVCYADNGGDPLPRSVKGTSV